MNFIIVPAAALIPLIVGFIWYHPKVFGNTWMKAADMTEEKTKGANMVKVFGLTYLFSLMLAMALMSIVIHQMHLFSLLMAGPDVDPNSESALMFKQLMDTYGTSYRTFKHGAFHGTLAGIFIALPIIGINALFERKGFKYIMVNTGYWAVSMALMGGTLCGFMQL